MAVTQLDIELQGQVNRLVRSLRINGDTVALAADRSYRARISVPSSAASVTLVATLADGSAQVRRLLLGHSAIPAAPL
ncbi:MAG: hypothetical protein PF961_05450 [Planctomycetota bacterium]|jgi:hypothetical protein|nr:hypothetical protein [Planctomycetota bacterium]